MADGADPGAHTHRGRENRMDKSLLSRSALVNLSLCGMFLAPTGTSKEDIQMTNKTNFM